MGDLAVRRHHSRETSRPRGSRDDVVPSGKPVKLLLVRKRGNEKLPTGRMCPDVAAVNRNRPARHDTSEKSARVVSAVHIDRGGTAEDADDTRRDAADKSSGVSG